MNNQRLKFVDRLHWLGNTAQFLWDDLYNEFMESKEQWTISEHLKLLHEFNYLTQEVNMLYCNITKTMKHRNMIEKRSEE